MAVKLLRAHVENGRIVVDDPTELPHGKGFGCWFHLRPRFRKHGCEEVPRVGLVIAD